MELRREIANYLYKTRGIQCDPDQLFITSGATQALSLTARLLYSPECFAAVEDPLNDGMRQIFTYAGYNLFPVPVDGFGISVDQLPEERPVFLYTTPSHQFPLGGLLPIKRRIALIEYARTMNCYIIEDDYDSEFRYSGQPVSSLLELAPDRVIYIGSFSKILAPALRLGFVILPRELVKPYRSLKRVSDVHTSLWEQLALTRLIETGGLERHIAGLRKLYSQRRNSMINALEEHFPGEVQILGDATGLHLIAEFAEHRFTEALLERIKTFGVKVYSVERHAIQKGDHLHQLILGYSHLEEDRIQEGIRRLSKALTEITETG
jgi:GntR family transcriptional regulator/MocR family aminotransferase